MTMQALAFAVLVLSGVGTSQKLDPNDPNDATDGVKLTVDVDGVTTKAGLMLDAQWRWVHTSDYVSCDDSAGNAAFNEQCLVQGLDKDTYASSYGVSVDTDANEITLKYAVVGNYTGATPNYGMRTFVTDLSSEDGGYLSLNLLGKEISFTADLSQVPAGMNAAVYLVSMDQFGNLGEEYPDGNVNEAGWKRGLGYCDAQCPTDLHFVQGAGWNTENALQSCCPEMDLLEANRFASAMTPHPCLSEVSTVCNETDPSVTCPDECDGVGADMNAFRSGGPGNELFKLVDPANPITVSTKFEVDDDGKLSSISQTMSTFPFETSALLTDEVAATQKELYTETNDFGETFGGLEQMGAAMEKGMVLVLSIWDDASTNMNWLDSCTVNSNQTYNCSDNSAFDDLDMWSSAFNQDGAGAWRGPADWHESVFDSYRTETVEFSNPAIPPGWRSQRKFECDLLTGEGGYIYDCSVSPYQVKISNITITTLPSSSSSSSKPQQ